MKTLIFLCKAFILQVGNEGLERGADFSKHREKPRPGTILEQAPSSKGPRGLAAVWWQFYGREQDKALSLLEVQGQSREVQASKPLRGPAFIACTCEER